MLATTTQTVTPTRTDQLEIVVSLQDIRDGVQGVAGQCAVAVALRRAGHHLVDVRHSQVHVDGREYYTTAELSRWLCQFDTRREFVHPDRFVLLPCETGAEA